MAGKDVGAVAGPEVEFHVPAPSMGRRLQGIEGLRAIAAFMVVALHVTLYSRGPQNTGWAWTDLVPQLLTGVTLFFTLSGFLLYRPFVAAALRPDSAVDVRAYLRNRALRILPGYWLALIAANVVLGALVLREASGPAHVGRTSDLGLLAKDALLLFNFDRATAFTGIAVAWSLVVEAVFYLALPFLGLLAARLAAGRGGRGARLAVLAPPALMLAVGLSGMLVTGTISTGGGDPLGGANWHALVARSFWPLAALFSCGMVVAVIRVELEDGRLSLPRGWFGLTAAATVLIAVLSAVLWNERVLGYHTYNLAASVACAGLLALVVCDSGRSRLVAALEWPPIAYAGVVSYGLFLWHVPLIEFLGRHGMPLHGGAGKVPGNMLLVSAVTLAVASLSWFVVERPALRRKKRMAAAPGAALGAEQVAPAPA